MKLLAPIATLEREHSSSDRNGPPNTAKQTYTSEHVDPRRLVAFLAMVFGMFMSILDFRSFRRRSQKFRADYQ